MALNRVLERARKGEKALGLSLSEPSDELVEHAGRMGLDFVHLDGQHSPFPPEVVDRLCRIADGTGITITMRVPDHQESTILSYLDRGVRLIVVPNLQTREQAQALVKYTFFAPIGLRSATSLRTVYHQNTDRAQLFADVNANTLVVPQLESVTAFENLDEILTVDDIDYFTYGFEDIAQSMGLQGQHAHPSVQEAWHETEDRVHAAGKGLLSELTESISVIGEISDGAKELLEKHGRKSLLSW